jgi:NADPH:quinone reductase
VKAWMSCQAGPPATLECVDLPAPEPGPREVRLRILACGLNYPDVLIIEDRYQVRPPRPFAPGAEVTGIVERLGPGVLTPAVGTRVMVVCSWGGLAEQLCVAAERCVPVPDGVSSDVAAAVQLTHGTAWHGLIECAALASGETLLVLGAAGGVGLAAVEIGKLRGARVVAAVSTAEKAAAARAAGADEAVLYGSGLLDPAASRALAASLKAACGAGADVVLDPVGGAFAEPALRAIRPKGRYVIAGFTAGIPSFPGNLILLKDARVMGAAWGAVVAQDLPSYRKTLDAVLDQLQTGHLRPRIMRELAFGQAPEGLECLRSRQAVGKVVVGVGA